MEPRCINTSIVDETGHLVNISTESRGGGRLNIMQYDLKFAVSYCEYLCPLKVPCSSGSIIESQSNVSSDSYL